MFCPNCATPNEADQNFCRLCGLRLTAIAGELAEQRPSVEYAEILRKKHKLESLGVISLSTAALIGLAMLLSKVFYDKIAHLGIDILLWPAFVAMILSGLLSVLFFNYPSIAMRFEKINPRLPATPRSDIAAPTTRNLLEERPFEPVPSVTEDSTELLHVDARTKKLD
jgi:hypothetical protein